MLLDSRTGGPPLAGGLEPAGEVVPARDLDARAPGELPTRSWRVLLLGGASGTGKTHVTYALARHFGVGITEVDDIQVALERVTTPEQQPRLHFWRTHRAAYERLTGEERLAHFVRVCREVFSPALEAVIANHLETDTPVVLEGDFILPELVTAVGQPGDVRAVFVTESDEAQLARNYLARDGAAQPDRAHESWRFDAWLTAECARLGVPTVAARPWETLFERAVALLGT